MMTTLRFVMATFCILTGVATLYGLLVVLRPADTRWRRALQLGWGFALIFLWAVAAASLGRQ